MPKILITGNGFDLNLGLPTHYNDFINILNCLKEDDFDFDKIYSKSVNYEKIKSNFNTFKFDQEKLEQLKEEIKNNIWFEFFNDEFKIETWIDFENKIKYVLDVLFSSFKYIENVFFSKGSLPLGSEGRVYPISIFNNNIEMIVILKIFSVLNPSTSDRIRFNHDFFVKKHDHYIGIDFDKISKKLNLELINFKKIFNSYFEIFVFPFYDNITNEIDKNRYKKFDKHFTFNFTNTFEKIYGKNDITEFLHGKIDSLENKIVLGINSLPQNDIDDRSFLPFTKYFQKLNNKTDYKFIQLYKKKDRENYEFFFLGHSMDRSDADYIIEIFNFVKELKTKNKIIIVCHNASSESKLLINLLDIIGKEDIENLMRNDILSFLQIDSSELNVALKRGVTKGNVYYAAISAGTS